MFTLNNYKVVFRHDVGELWFARKYNGRTRCWILMGKDTKLTDTSMHLYGEALCSEIDQFNRAIGRKVALARALKPFDKETRTRFWQKYFEVLGGVK